MIKITTQRTDRGGHDDGTIEREEPLHNAIVSFIKYELAYGGKIVETTKDKIVVKTKVLSKTDTVTFTGPEEEMEYFWPVLTVWSKVVKHTPVENFMDDILKKTDGKPLYITAATDMLIGSERVKKLVEHLQGQL